MIWVFCCSERDEEEAGEGVRGRGGMNVGSLPVVLFFLTCYVPSCPVLVSCQPVSPLCLCVLSYYVYRLYVAYDTYAGLSTLVLLPLLPSTPHLFPSHLFAPFSSFLRLAPFAPVTYFDDRGSRVS